MEVFPRLDKLQCARFQPEGIAKNGLGRSVSVMHGRFHLYQQATHAVLGSCAVAGQCLQLRVNRSVMHHPEDKDNTVLQVLPDLSDWSYWGKDEVNGQPAYVYEYKQR